MAAQTGGFSPSFEGGARYRECRLMAEKNFIRDREEIERIPRDISTLFEGSTYSLFCVASKSRGRKFDRFRISLFSIRSL